MSATIVLVFIALLCGVSLFLADEGLLAHYAFDEGSGDVLRDLVGESHGKIHGAAWVRSGDGWALRLDGEDGFVEFGKPDALSPGEAITLEAWVYPEAIPSVGEPGIVGKSYDNYVLTYYGNGHVWWYTGNSTVNAHAAVTPMAWHHIVGTYDGEMMKLYVDGELAAANKGKNPGIPAGKGFWMGKSEGSVQWTKNAHFLGMIDEVRLYDRAISAQEIREHYRTTKLTHEPDVTAYEHCANREIVAQADVRGLGELQPGTSLRVELVKAGARAPLARVAIPDVESWSKPSASLRHADIQPGDYEVRVVAVGPDGKRLGRPGTARVTWPEPPSWGVSDPNVKILNSLVSELLSVDEISERRTRLAFTNPREGWVFFSSTAAIGERGQVRVELPGRDDLRTVIRQREGDEAVAEGMRRLPKGRHELIVRCHGDAWVEHLVVRSIPEIGYCRIDSGPQVRPYGPCDWSYLEKHILPHINLAVSHGSEAERQHWREWKRQGKRWIVETPLPGIGKTDGVSADEVETAWVERGKVAEPLLDGMIVDEFGASDAPIWQSWHEALRRIKARPDFAAKVYYPYCGPLFGATASREFAQTVIDSGWAVALERYLPEQRTEAAARALVNSSVIETLRQWEEAQPGAIAHTLLVWGFFISAPPESTNVDPSVDYKSFMDIQMHMVANDPACFGLYGMTSYLSGYSDEESIRWCGKLYRHYCIEGRTDRLTDYYRLEHVDNPDFQHGLSGWQVGPAEKGSIDTGSMPGFSFLEGRYPQTQQGDTYARMKRSAAGPNRLGQTIGNLVPGELYSLKMMSGDLGDLRAGRSERKVHALSVDIDGVEVVPELTFQFPFGSCYSHVVGEFNRNNPAYLNLFNVVFRAQAQEATLTISDWKTAEDAGGPVGQELVFNFVEVQPYFGD